MTEQEDNKADALSNAKHERFCQEYLVDLNATQAAIRAGYSAGSAEVTGSRLLGNAKVAGRVAELMAERAERVQVSQDAVVRELALIAFSDGRHYTMDDLGGLQVAADAPPAATRAIASVKHKTRTDKDGAVTHEVEYRLWNKNDALKQLREHLGGNKQRVELTGKDGEPLFKQVWEIGGRRLEF